MDFKPIYIFLIVLFLQDFRVNAEEENCPQLVNYRLTKDVKPTHYKFTVRPSLPNLSFKGTGKISLLLKKQTKEITLNSATGLFFSTIQLVLRNKTLNGSAIYCPQEGTVTFTFPENIDEPKAVLRIKYNGIIDERKTFYRLKHSNEKKFGAVAKYEPSYSIPCFDEPSFKAPVSLSVIAENNKTVISNMPVKSKKPLTVGGYNLTKITFETSPALPTYMTSIIEGYFDYVEKRLDNHSLPIRVYTPAGLNETGLFALNVTAHALRFFIDYFNSSYPLPKLDILGINIGDSSILENWGVITIENHILLVHNGSSNEQMHKLIPLICRKISHQWIGGLVTIDWLTQSWLYQGLNTLLQYKCLQKLYPKWNVWNNFLVSKTAHAFEFDAKTSSRRLQQWINNPELFALYYDPSSHSKGAAVIRMLEDWIGSENFTKGVRLFISRNKYGNAKTKDFLSAMKSVTNLPVDRVVQTWINEPGYPLITINKPNCKICPGFEVRQRKFTENGVLSEKDAKMTWSIPLNYIIDNSTVGTTLIESENETVVAQNKQNNVILLNPDCRGFYRVKYFKEMYDELFKQVHSKTLNERSRFMLQSNFFALAKAGQESTSDYLNYLKAYIDEDEDIVWFQIDKSLEEISSILDGTGLEHKFNSYVKKLLKNITSKVEWQPKPNEEWSRTMVRPVVINRLGLVGDEAVVKEAFSRFEKHFKNETRLLTDLCPAVMRTVIANNKNGSFQQFIEIYKNSSSDLEKLLLNNAMGMTKNETQIHQLLDFAMSEEVADSDTVGMLLSVTSTANGREILWEYFVDNQTELRTLFDNVNYHKLWLNLIHGMVSSFTCLKKANEIERYFEDNPSKDIDYVLKNALEVVRMKAHWFLRDNKALLEFFDTQASTV